MFKVLGLLLFCFNFSWAASKLSIPKASSPALEVSSVDSLELPRSSQPSVAILQTNLAVLSKGGGFLGIEFSKNQNLSFGVSLYNLMEKEKNKVTTVNRYGIGGTYYLHGVQAPRTVFAGAALYFGQQSTREAFTENIENMNGIGVKAGGHISISQSVVVDVGLQMTGFSGYFLGEPMLGVGLTF